MSGPEYDAAVKRLKALDDADMRNAVESIRRGLWDDHLAYVEHTARHRRQLLDPAKPPPRRNLKQHQRWEWCTDLGSTPRWIIVTQP